MIRLCVMLLLCTSLGFGQDPKISGTDSGAGSITGRVTVATGQGQADPLAGIEVQLSGPSLGAAPRFTVTDADGHFQFVRLPPGTYQLETKLENFRPWSSTVTLERDQAAVADALLRINSADQGIEVQGDATDIATQSIETSAVLNEQQLDSLPLAQQKFTEALPLVPGVIRTPEGRLNFNGQTEYRGLLLVNSTENVDPATGSFSVPVPVDTIQSMIVDNAPASAEYGGFSGGLTRIETKAPPSAWNYKLADLTPSFRGKGGHLVGLGQWTPRFLFAGPLLKDKLNFSEEVTYEIRKAVVRGLPWPFNETKTHGFTSFTQLQFILSPRHLVNANVNVFPIRTEFANISALVPQSASSDYGQHGVSADLSDSYQFGSGALLSTSFRYTRFGSNAGGRGPANMEITPEGWEGNFFNTWSRVAHEMEGLPTLQLPAKSWHGRHEIKIGLDVSHRSYSGSNLSHPVQLLREDGSLAEQIEFQGAGQLNAANTEIAEFIQDHWSLSPHLALDAGGRFASQSLGRSAAFAPRAGVAYSLGSGEKTVLRAGAGIFFGHVPLLAISFPDNQDRVISLFDSSGVISGEPIVLHNTYLSTGGGFGSPNGPVDPGISPRTFTWKLEIEREILANFDLRVSYLDTQTQNLFVVSPLLSSVANGNSILGLSGGGASHYRQIEATIHVRPFHRDDVNISYVWSRARGDLNVLEDVFVPFVQPVIRPNFSGILPSDVPHRLVAWGQFQLPWKLTLSPVIDVHSGLPFSDVDVLQNYVGTPNRERFPIFFSLDAQIYREFPLRAPFIGRSKTRKLRFGVYSLNITNRQNPHAVYGVSTSPLFGTFAGFDRRIDGLVIDIVN